MDNIKETIKSWFPNQRRLIQLYSALLYNAHVKGFISGSIYTGNVKGLCVPGLNCYSCPGAVGACPLGALQNAVSASGSGSLSYVLGIIMLYGIILGRTVCGYLCPTGLLQELLYKIPTVKMRKNRFTSGLSLLKYVILLVFVFIIPFWYSLKHFPLPAFCKYICPTGTFEGAVGLLSNRANSVLFSLLGLLFTRKFVILCVLSCLSVFIFRAFCRFFCPLGALYGLFSRFNLIGVKLDDSRCVDCGICVKYCEMDIKKVADRECINCGECIDKCPTKAISFKAGNIVLRENEDLSLSQDKTECKYNFKYLWLLAVMLLVLVLYFVNR